MFRLFERIGLHVLPVHYYSPVPEVRELEDRRKEWDRPWYFGDVDLAVDSAQRLVVELQPFLAEARSLASNAEQMRRGLGQGFGDIDGCLAYAMVRRIRPARIVEVGGGVSTYFLAEACARNRAEDGCMVSHRCIDLAPTPELSNYCEGANVQLLVDDVRSIPRAELLDLKAHDLLFVDSSHVVSLNSDVTHIVLEVLPALAHGVVVHFHDIAFPRLAPRPDYWILTMHQFWTEAALLKAFLSHNHEFEVLLCAGAMGEAGRQKFLRAVGASDATVEEPSSLYLRRSAASR
ncbi:MAG: class I SAM-dependent methyltransferase [Gemmatimonadaceae bacterium]